MTIARLLLANALELCAGTGLAALLRVPLGTGYLLGLAVVGIVSAHLALVHVAAGWLALSLLAAAGLAALALRRPRLGRPRLADLAGGGLLVALLVHAWPAFASRPLVDYDSWAIWGLKGKALDLLGWVDPSLFANRVATPAHIDYPLLVPSLEAVAARAMGGFDVRPMHLQFLLLGAAGLLALQALLRRSVASLVMWPLLLALAAAPSFTGQLITAYADVPLALFVAAGLVAAGRWLVDGSGRMLALAALFFGAASLTKNEGVIFSVAALAGLLLATRRWRPVVAAAAGIELLLLPWQVFLAVHRIHSETLLSFQSFDVRYPGVTYWALKALLQQSLGFHAWPLLLPLFAVAALACTGSRLAVFAWTWALVSLGGLTWVYVVSKIPYSLNLEYSDNRVVDSLVVGAAALTPLLVAETTRIARR